MCPVRAVSQCGFHQRRKYPRGGIRLASLFALTAYEGCEQASEANPASRIFTALMRSALADSPHWTHSNLACVLRLSADTRPHPPKDTGQVRLVFCGGTGYNRPPLHSVLYSS